MFVCACKRFLTRVSSWIEVSLYVGMVTNNKLTHLHIYIIIFSKEFEFNDNSGI